MALLVAVQAIAHSLADTVVADPVVAERIVGHKSVVRAGVGKWAGFVVGVVEGSVVASVCLFAEKAAFFDCGTCNRPSSQEFQNLCLVGHQAIDLIVF